MKKLVQTSLIGLSCLFAMSQSSSAATCADQGFVVAQLEKKFGETLLTFAVNADSNMLGIYASPKAKTWSVILTLPDRNLACLAGTGRGKAELHALLTRL